MNPSQQWQQRTNLWHAVTRPAPGPKATNKRPAARRNPRRFRVARPRLQVQRCRSVTAPWRRETARKVHGKNQLHSRQTVNETGHSDKRRARCHEKLGLGVRSRNLWNGRWWVHVLYCSTHCDALNELERYNARAERGWHSIPRSSPQN